MLNLFKFKFLLLIIIVLSGIEVMAQYKYTRFSVDVNAGASLPRTSIPGSISGFGEIGFKGTLSRYLSLRASGGYGTAKGSRDVTQMVGKPESVDNYTKYNTTYTYLTGSAHINLDKIFRLRKENGGFKRLTPFLVIGSGIMLPDIKVNRFDGQFKNYSSNLRFVTHNFGLDFNHFLSNRFDLVFGVEYRMIQSYYFDGAFSDKKLDGLINAHVGLSYNIGASADRKHMDWYNLDGQTDVIFAPEEQKKLPEPISQNSPKEDTTVALAIADKPIDTPEDTTNHAVSEQENIELTEGVPSVKDTVVVAAATPVEPPATSKPVEPVMAAEPVKPAQNTAAVPRKVGRHVDIRPEPIQPRVLVDKTDNTEKVAVDQPVVNEKPATVEASAGDGSLNSIDGIVRPLGKYNVIAGTYSGSRYAYLFRDKLRKQGFEAALFKSSDRSKMVRVAVYYGNNKAEAMRQLRLYQSKFGAQAWIHVYDPK